MKKERVKRFILFIIGLFFSALGVAVTKSGELGVSPISSVANVLSERFTALSMGAWLMIWNCILIAGQALILRKKFRPFQLLQIPVAFLFGYFTDFGLWCVSFVPVNTYPMRLAMVIAGVVLLGFGVALVVIANVIMNAGEAFVKAVSDVVNKSFGNVKIAFDVSCVILAVLLSLLFFDFRIVGAREGTVIAAVLTGMTVKLFTKCLQEPLSRLLVSSNEMRPTTDS